MYAFSYWHTYYDSTFLNHPFIISNSLYNDLKITGVNRNWPQLPHLPELPRLFQLLQRMILAQKNWVSSSLSQQETDSIQAKINSIIINLQCEKEYGFQFWERQPRRIQASVIHFYQYLKYLIESIIPGDCQTLMEANRKEKLITTFSRLETLVNDIISIIGPIYKFMLLEYFSQEQKLTKQFFQELKQLLKSLPNIKKQNLIKVPKLMEYICIVNPIESNHFHPQSILINKKNATSDEDNTIQDFENRRRKKSKNSDESSKNSIQLGPKVRKISFNKMPVQLSPRREILQNLHIFKFPQKVRKPSSSIKAKKLTITSYDTKDKTASLEKDRSPTHDRSLTMFGQNSPKKRTETLNEGRSKQLSIYMERRPRQVSTKSIYSRDKNYKNSGTQKEEAEYERQDKIKKKKGAKIPIKTSILSQNKNLNDGKSRGWGILREWFRERLAKRKLQKILLGL